MRDPTLASLRISLVLPGTPAAWSSKVFHPLHLCLMNMGETYAYPSLTASGLRHAVHGKCWISQCVYEPCPFSLTCARRQRDSRAVGTLRQSKCCQRVVELKAAPKVLEFSQMPQCRGGEGWWTVW